MTPLQKERLAARVRKGRDWLDTNQPGWRDRVSVNDLRMYDVCKCVLGQLFEPQARQAGMVQDRGSCAGIGIGFNWAVRDEQIMDDGAARALGFDYAVADENDVTEEFNGLQKLWVKVIKGEEI